MRWFAMLIAGLWVVAGGCAGALRCDDCGYRVMPDGSRQFIPGTRVGVSRTLSVTREAACDVLAIVVPGPSRPPYSPSSLAW